MQGMDKTLDIPLIGVNLHMVYSATDQTNPTTNELPFNWKSDTGAEVMLDIGKNFVLLCRKQFYIWMCFGNQFTVYDLEKCWFV